LRATGKRGRGALLFGDFSPEPYQLINSRHQYLQKNNPLLRDKKVQSTPELLAKKLRDDITFPLVCQEAFVYFLLGSSLSDLSANRNWIQRAHEAKKAASRIVQIATV
jgi:hypothetical protein